MTAGGKLCTWGYGQVGLLGHGDTADKHAPRRVEALQGDLWVVVVSIRFANIVAATRGDSVLGWGQRETLNQPNNAIVPEVLIGNTCVSLCHYPQKSCERTAGVTVCAVYTMHTPGPSTPGRYFAHRATDGLPRRRLLLFQCVYGARLSAYNATTMIALYLRF